MDGPAAAADDVAFRRALPTDEDDIVAMYETVFGRARTHAEVAHRLREGPAGPAVQIVIEDGDRIVGHTAMLPLPAWIRGEREMITIGLDSMVLPTHQARGLLRRTAEALGPWMPSELGVSFLHEGADAPVDATGIRRRVTGSDLERRVPQWVRWHDGRRLAESRGKPLPRVAEPMVTGVLRIVRLLARVASSTVRVRKERPSDHELDALAAASASFATITPFRDAAFVRWRWPDDGRWEFWTVRDRHGGLVGWAVAGIDPDRAEGTGIVGDIVSTTRRATTALLTRASEDLAGQGARIVTFAYRDPRPWANRAVAMAGFARRGVAPPMLPFSRSGEISDLFESDHWYVTTGLFI